MNPYIKQTQQEEAAYLENQEVEKMNIYNKQPPRAPNNNKFTLAFIFLVIVVIIYSYMQVNTHPKSKQMISQIKQKEKFLQKVQEVVQPEQQQIYQVQKIETITKSITVTDSKEIIMKKIAEQQTAHTPKILWIYSQREIQSLKMIQSLSAKHLIQVGESSGFDVRIVNSITAYDWLSKEMVQLIRIMKHQSKYIIYIDELIKLGLLIEHGGLWITYPNYILPQKLDWIYDLFNKDLASVVKPGEIEYCNNKKQPELLLLYQNSQVGKVYADSLIYARKNSVFLREIMKQMYNVLTQGKWQSQKHPNIEKPNQLSVSYIYNIFVGYLNFKQPDLCEKYQVLSINKISPFVFKANQTTLRSELIIDKQAFFKKNGKVFMIEGDLGVLNSNFWQVLWRQRTGIAHNNSIFLTDFISTKRNQWMMIPVSKTRQVNYCIISLKPLSLQDYQSKIKESIDRLKEQSYDNWSAIYFVKGFSQIYKKADKHTLLVNSSQYEGLNLQRAATRYCKKTDTAVLLDYDETFGYKQDFKNIAQKMTNRSTYGVIISVKNDHNILKANVIQENVRRKIHGSNEVLIRQIAYNFRVFTIYSYKHIPHMSLHDNQGRYYNRQIPLLTLLEMTQNYKPCEENLYFTKPILQKIDVPKYRVALPNTFINMPFKREVDLTLEEYSFKYAASNLCEAIKVYSDRTGKPLNTFFVLNDGTEYQGIQSRKDLPQLMQKKIHQIWLDDEIPKFKQLLLNKIQLSHPDYQYLLWTKANITKANFPATFDILTTLLQFHKSGKQNKIEMILDIMKGEIIFSHGGIYIDPNYLVFKKNSFDDWLTYKAVLGSQIYPLHRFQKQGYVFAAMKGYEPLRRLFDQRVISTRNHYSKQTNIESGTVFFSRTIIGDEELDTEIFQPSFEYIYSYYPWDLSRSTNLCEADEKVTKQEDILLKNKRSYARDCSKFYPVSIGMELWDQW